jgi:hypothetical protein
VTRPTTIRAITEMPANTPRPIGRTDSFFPGSVKAAWEEEELAAAAETEDAAAEDDDESAADVAGVAADVDVPLEEFPEALDVALPEEDAEEGAAVGVAAGTVDTPYNILTSAHVQSNHSIFASGIAACVIVKVATRVS